MARREVGPTMARAKKAVKEPKAPKSKASKIERLVDVWFDHAVWDAKAGAITIYRDQRKGDAMTYSIDETLLVAPDSIRMHVNTETRKMNGYMTIPASVAKLMPKGMV